MRNLSILLMSLFYTSAHAVTLSAVGVIPSTTNFELNALKESPHESYVACAVLGTNGEAVNIRLTNQRTGKGSAFICLAANISDEVSWGDNNIGDVVIGDVFSAEIKSSSIANDMFAVVFVCPTRNTGNCLAGAPYVPLAPATKGTCEADVPESIVLDDMHPVKGKVEDMPSYYVGNNITGVLTYTPRKTNNNMGLLTGSDDSSGIHYKINNLPLSSGSSSWVTGPGINYLQIDSEMSGVKPGEYRGYLDVTLACE